MPPRNCPIRLATVSILALALSIASDSPPSRSALDRTEHGELLATIDKGVVFANGVRVYPPFRFSTLDGVLLMNGIPFKPRRAAANNVTPTPEVIQRATERHALSVRAIKEAREHSTRSARLEAMRRVYEGDSLVHSVTPVTDGGLRVTYKSAPEQRNWVSIPRIDSPPPPPDPEEVHQAKIDAFRRRVLSGTLVVFGEGYYILAPQRTIVPTLDLVERILSGENVQDSEFGNTILQLEKFRADVYEQRDLRGAP